MKQSIAIVMAVIVLIAAYLAIRSGDSSDRDDDGTITLRGASQFGEAHAFTRTLRKFEQLVDEYYDGDVEFELYLNSELGLEKDYLAYMSQGISVDYGIVSPAHMSTFSQRAPMMDIPFLYRDVDHWSKVLDSDALQPLADEVSSNADVLLIGYAGGGVRNLIAKSPITHVDQLQGLTIRVMGAPIQTRIFQAIGTSPTVISYGEVYNAMQTGVIDAAENEAAGTEQMKFFEVGPEICLTQHAITVRPLCFSGKTFRGLPESLQQAIRRAGREAGGYGRQLESTEDSAILARLEKDRKLRVHPFRGREELLRMAEPVKAAYAREIDAQDVLARINAIQ